LQKLVFLTYFWERKNGVRDSDEKGRDAGFSSKRSGNAGSGPPLPDPEHKVMLVTWKQKGKQKLMTADISISTKPQITLTRI